MSVGSPFKFNWLEQSVRSCMACIGVGLSVEALVVLLHMVIKHFQETRVRPLGLRYATLYSMNALVGLVGTLVLVYGIICLIRALRVSRMATAWGYSAGICIIGFKLMDAVNSYHYLYFRDMLGLRVDIDVFVMNLLLIASAASLMIAMVYALFDLRKAELVLEERNQALGREIQERRLLATAIENAAESILITNASGIIQYVNPAFERLTGFSQEDVAGHTPRILKSGHHDAAFYRELWDAISVGRVWRGHFQNRRKDGFLFNEDATISAIQDEKGGITHYVAVKRDVTREKQLEQQLQQSQKLEAIGTLAGGIAHDLNNVLAVIIGHSEISMERLEPDHPVRKSLEVIMRTAHRSSQLIKRLLMFSRQGVAEAAPMEPAPLVREQMKIIRSYLPSNITIADAVDKHAGYILGEPIEIQQIIFNLCTNANHAMQPGGGTLKIELAGTHLDEARVVATGMLMPGDYILLRVTDTGCGMDASVQKRVFDPFFTTKDPGLGTGLGLSMVHGCIMRNGGGIDIKSAPGQGSRFDLYWPRLAYEQSEPVHETVIGDGGGRKVLIVDDVDDFRNLLEASLVTHGFYPTAFGGGAEALAFLANAPSAVDVALVDYMMPTMNGSELAQCLHEIRPDLPVVLMSGYSCAVTEENAAEFGFRAVLNKPVETARLVQTLLQCAPTEEAYHENKEAATQ